VLCFQGDWGVFLRDGRFWICPAAAVYPNLVPHFQGLPPIACPAYRLSPTPVMLLMDSATRQLAHEQGLIPVVPPNPRRRQPWLHDKQRATNDETVFGACSGV